MARWMALMASTDGVVSSSERKVLKDFAKAYGLDSNKLYRMAFAFANDVDYPEVEEVSISEIKGRRFEQFVVSLCSDKTRFKLLAWRSDKIVGNTYAAPYYYMHGQCDARRSIYLYSCLILYNMCTECKFTPFLPHSHNFLVLLHYKPTFAQ